MNDMNVPDSNRSLSGLRRLLVAACVAAVVAGPSSFASAQGLRSDAQVLAEMFIQADGPGGVDTYEIFRRQLGETCIEAPDVFANNHQGDPHIVENTGSPFGPYFTFLIHRDFDEDKNYDGSEGRQRNEIKGDGNSPELVKARAGEQIRYHWYFRIDPNYRGEENHTIFFQLHNVDVGPIVKIQSYHSDLAIRYDPDNENDDEVVLASHPFDPLLGQWLEVDVVATFSNRGYLRMSVRDESGAIVMDTERFNIDMWTTEYTRPKWGIYRALDRSITNSEDRADFADITIQDLAEITPREKPATGNTGMNLEAYPNPFRSRTTVAVTLDHGSDVRLEVLDVLGRRVETLLDAFLPVGKSVRILDGRGLPAGIYVLSLRADDRSATRMVHYSPN